MKESESRMENISSTMVISKHIYGEDTIFYTMEKLLENNPLEKWIGLIRRETSKTAAEDSRW